MIFAIGKHIELITKGLKTQTRRSSDRYEVGKLYSIQPGRTKKGISDGKIRIVDKLCEVWPYTIRPDDALAEGGYNAEKFEELYAKLHPDWGFRWAYTFRFIPSVSVKGDKTQ